MTGTQPREWQSFAEERTDGSGFLTIEPWIQAVHMSGVPKEQIVTVKLIEDPAGDFRGWLAAGENHVVMVQHKRIFPIQFAYGVEAAVEKGDGVPVKLRVEKIANVYPSE